MIGARARGAVSDSRERGLEEAAVDSPRPSEGSEEAADLVQADFEALLEDTKRERDEYLELAQRTRADFENYRKRMRRRGGCRRQSRQGELAAELIGVIDNLERALAAAEIEAAAALDGEAAVEGPLGAGDRPHLPGADRRPPARRCRGVRPGRRDVRPAWHEALQTRSADGRRARHRVEVLQKGYRLDGQVLRAARVVVSE